MPQQYDFLAHAKLSASNMVIIWIGQKEVCKCHNFNTPPYETKGMPRVPAKRRRKDTSPRKKSSKVSPIPEDIHNRQLNDINRIGTTKFINKPTASRDQLKTQTTRQMSTRDSTLGYHTQGMKNQPMTSEVNWRFTRMNERVKWVEQVLLPWSTYAYAAIHLKPENNNIENVSSKNSESSKCKKG
jgi:hypothetical protein